MNAQVIATLPIIFASLYALIVSVCVAGRMTRRTPFIVRLPVVILGFLAFWAILRSMAGDWSLDVTAVSHATAVIIGAIALVMMPRIPT